MKWLTLRIGGQRWGVYLVSPKSKHLNDGEEQLDGYCCYETARIFVSRVLSESVREDVLLHELLHAILHVSTASQEYSNSRARLEERVVGPITPIMHAVLKDLGFRFPRGPYL